MLTAGSGHTAGGKKEGEESTQGKKNREPRSQILPITDAEAIFVPSCVTKLLPQPHDSLWSIGQLLAAGGR